MSGTCVRGAVAEDSRGFTEATPQEKKRSEQIVFATHDLT